MMSKLLYKVMIVYDSNSDCYIEVDRNCEIFHMPIRFITQTGRLLFNVSDEAICRLGWTLLLCPFHAAPFFGRWPLSATK